MRPFRLLVLLAITFPMFSAWTQEPWLLDFKKPATNPILGPDSTALFLDPITDSPVHWQKADVFNPGAVVRNDTVFLLFRAEDDPDAILGGRTSRVGLAYSTDGVNFSKDPSPVLYPDRDDFSQWDHPGGVEDPRIVELEDGTYLMLYTSWNRKTARLSAAVSRDLRSWEKKGPVFKKAYDGKFLDTWSKSGSVVTELVNGRLVAKKIMDKYWMYWGELFMNLAHSDDGIHWQPLLDDKGQLLHVFEPSLREFDSHLVEPGPPALYTKAGILVLYNGKNLSGPEAGSLVPENTYCGGQVLFSNRNPAKFLQRLAEPFICPSLPHEIKGQYQAGTTFIQGLVYFKGQWFLYYGTADSMVGVAISEAE